MNYQELIEDHDHIDQLASQIEAIVRSNPADRTVVDKIMNDLAGIVDDHLSKEDSLIYPQLAASSDPADAASLIVEFEEIKRDWQTYLAAWKDGQASHDWPNFKSSTVSMLERLRTRVMKETGLLYSMAVREGLIAMEVRVPEVDLATA